jgi:ABC-2 type transport system ATP-binding protein
VERVLEIQNLNKYYGTLKAVNDLSFSVEKGQIYGILGPNGSGKTTTLGMITSVLNPTKGNFKWFGQQINNQVKRRIGTILETPNFYPYLSAKRNLQISALIKNCDKKRIDEVIEFVGLSEYKKLNFKKFSLGMKQRLAIANALLANPEVLILDEPTNGLDPTGIIEVREMIIELANQGKTILLASHLLDEVQKICTHTVILKKGKLLYNGLISESDSNQIEISCSNIDNLKSSLGEINGLNLLEEKDNYLTVELETMKSEELNRILFEKGITLSHLSTKRHGLEKIFMDITGLKK